MGGGGGVTQLASPIKTETIIFKINLTRLRVPTGWRQTCEPLNIVTKELTQEYWEHLQVLAKAGFELGAYGCKSSTLTTQPNCLNNLE